MIRREEGFTLVELMVTMVIFVLVIAAASGVFTALLTQFKQQSKIAETNIEGMVGLELLRQDIENAGYGLPWNPFPALPASYKEAAADPYTLNDSPTDPPRALVAANNMPTAGTYVSGTDYLVIKALNVSKTDPTVVSPEKWTIIKDPAKYPYADPNNYNPRTWKTIAGSTDNAQTLQPNDRVIVFSGVTGKVERNLVTSGSAFYTTYANIINDPWQPQETNETRVVYGISSSTDPVPVRPFNRADYFVQVPAAMPGRCAAGTGILYKAMMNQDDTGTYTLLALLDCVADMQVVFGLDMGSSAGPEPDGIIGTYANADYTTVADAAGITQINEAKFKEAATPGSVRALLTKLNTSTTKGPAEEIRGRLKEVRIYILAHEGQRDPNYTYPNYPASTITVGELGLGRTFTFATSGIANWQNYRWKLYTLVVKPRNLE